MRDQEDDIASFLLKIQFAYLVQRVLVTDLGKHAASDLSGLELKNYQGVRH